MVRYDKNNQQDHSYLYYTIRAPYHQYSPQYRPYGPHDFYSCYSSLPHPGWNQIVMGNSKHPQTRSHSPYHSHPASYDPSHVTTHQDPGMLEDQRQSKKKIRPKSIYTDISFPVNNASTNRNMATEIESLNSLDILAMENSKRNEQLDNIVATFTSTPFHYDNASNTSSSNNHDSTPSLPSVNIYDNIPRLPSSNNEPLKQRNLTSTIEDPIPSDRSTQSTNTSIFSGTTTHQCIKYKSRRWSFFDLFRKPSPSNHVSSPAPNDLGRLQDIAKMDQIWCFKTSGSPSRIIWTGFDYNNQLLLTNHATHNELVLVDSHICQGSLPFLVVITQQLAYYSDTNNAIKKVEIRCLPNTDDTTVLRKRIMG